MKKTSKVNIRVSTTLHEKFAELAKQNGTSASELGRRLIQEYVTNTPLKDKE